MVFGLTVPFWIAAMALAVCALLVAVALPREAPSKETSSWWQVARDQHSLNLLRHTELRMLFIVQLAFTCGVTAFYEFYPLWLVEVAGYGARGIANAFYNATVPAWCAERFGSLGQGAVMGLLSTTFCLANILMALAGSVLTLIDTRLILLLGAAFTAWSAWRLQGWRVQMAGPAAVAGEAR